MKHRKIAIISIIVLILFSLLYFFYLKDWMKPVVIDLNPVKNITYFNGKPAEKYKSVMKNILEQCRGSQPVNKDMEYRSTNKELGFERLSAFDKESKYLSITYYFRDKENIDNPLGQELSYVYVNIISNNQVNTSVSNVLGSSTGTYFSDVNSASKFKQYYKSEHGFFRPIFDLLSQKGKAGNFNYLISPFCKIEDEYGFKIYDVGATTDMYFAWDDYTIVIHELTYNFNNNFSTPIVLKDLEALLKQADANYTE